MHENSNKPMASAVTRLKKNKYHKRTRRSKFNKKPPRDTISLVHVNVRGLKSKIKDVHCLLEDLDVDIMILSETKLCGTENRILPGYRNFRLNRNTRAGGVTIYFKEELKIELIKKNPE